MTYFLVSVRKAGEPVKHFFRLAFNSAAAYDLVAAEQDDSAFGITVVPA